MRLDLPTYFVAAFPWFVLSNLFYSPAAIIVGATSSTETISSSSPSFDRNDLSHNKLLQLLPPAWQHYINNFDFIKYFVVYSQKVPQIRPVVQKSLQLSKHEAGMCSKQV